MSSTALPALDFEHHNAKIPEVARCFFSSKMSKRQSVRYEPKARARIRSRSWSLGTSIETSTKELLGVTLKWSRTAANAGSEGEDSLARYLRTSTDACRICESMTESCGVSVAISKRTATVDEEAFALTTSDRISVKIFEESVNCPAPGTS